MKKKKTILEKKISRRKFVKNSVYTGLALGVFPGILTYPSDALAESFGANINWRQAEGSEITVGLIPAGYFKNLANVKSTFEDLTGVKLNIEMTPPAQIRNKAMLDFSKKTGMWATNCTDPMFYYLYEANGWVDRLDEYLENPKLTDKKWFDYEDIQASWRGTTSVKGVPYGIPFDGEATCQIYRKDIYDKVGIKPANTLDEYLSNAQKIHDPKNRLWAAAVRGMKGAGQNMYIYPSILAGYGGKWFNSSGKMTVHTPEAIGALDYYVKLQKSFAPSGVSNWNWPDLADAFGQGTLGSYIDANSTAAVINNAEKSKVVGKIGYARWPKGPSGKRVCSIWNWSFPINAALSEKDKVATWLFIQWACSKETQAATSHKFAGAYKRVGVNRNSVWKNSDFQSLMSKMGDNFVDTSIKSYNQDTDADWRPRTAKWPAIGGEMATAIQSALVGEKSSSQALIDAQAKIDKLMMG